jgi:hypothetical protein
MYRIDRKQRRGQSGRRSIRAVDIVKKEGAAPGSSCGNEAIRLRGEATRVETKPTKAKACGNEPKWQFGHTSVASATGRYRASTTKSKRAARPSPASAMRISSAGRNRPSRRFAGSSGK